MKQTEVAGVLHVDLCETNGNEELYATESPKMNQSSNETTKFDLVVETSALYNDHDSACLDNYGPVRIIAGHQSVAEIRFGSREHFELQSHGMVADSEEENWSSSPESSSTTNCDIPGCTEQNMQLCCYNDSDEMIDEDGPVLLNPEFVMCNTTLHMEPRLTFSSDGFKLECFDLDSCGDDERIALEWVISDIIYVGCEWTPSVASVMLTLHVKSNAETGDSDPVRVQFCLTDMQWPKKQEKIWLLASRYQEIWNNISLDDLVSESWSIEPGLFFPKQYFSDTKDFEDVIYPKGDPDAVSISQRDVELLLPETFVNDTIIDFYIKYLSTRIQPTEKHRYHFFNSFFFRKLADLDKDQGKAPEGRAAFLRVRKWTRKINLFEKDFLFIPVNFNLHWSLIIICYPGEVATFEDDDMMTSPKVPCILHMDSLKGSHSGLKDIIQSYLWEEWKERHPESASDNSDKFLNLRFVSLELPQQDNSFDCGLFLLHYVELFLTDAPSSFNPLKIDAFSSFLSDDWFPPAEASLKRSLIRKLICELVTESSQHYPPPPATCSNEHFDVRHQRSDDVAPEAAIGFLAQRCPAVELDSVCALRDGTLEMQQLSTSICLEDLEEKIVPTSRCILETGRVSMVSVENLDKLRECLDNDKVICSSSQDEENAPTISNNQLGSRLSTPKDAEVFKASGCMITDKYSDEDSSLVCLDDSQKISSQAETGVHDIMDSKCCSMSGNAEEVIVCDEHSLERNTDEVEDERYVASQDMGSVMMDDASKDDVGPHPERNGVEVEDDKCEHLEDTGSFMVDGAGKYFAERSLERNTAKVEDKICEASQQAYTAIVDDDSKGYLKETSTAVDEFKGCERHISSELKEGSTDNSIACDDAKGIDAHPADGKDGGDARVIGENVSCENRNCSHVEILRPDGTCSEKDIETSENMTSDAKRPHPDSICDEKDVAISDEECSLHKDDDGSTDVKAERQYKRRKVVTPEGEKRRTRSSTREAS